MSSRVASLGWLVAVAVLLTACAPEPPPVEERVPPEPMPPSERPNVLLISLDDLNDWVGFLDGHPQVETPNLDRLAARGTVFEHAYADAPACNPARSATMTGLRPTTTGIYTNNQPLRVALPEAETLPEYFGTFGYHLFAAGKVFHDSRTEEHLWADHYRRRSQNDAAPARRPANGLPDTEHFDWGPLDEGDEALDDDRVVAWVAERLRKGLPEPFFLAVGLYRPHLPWYVPAEHFTVPADEVVVPPLPVDDLEDVPEPALALADRTKHQAVLRSDNHRSAVAAYLASIRYADAKVGELLAAFEEGAHDRGTVIVLWSDHGMHLGEKEHWGKYTLWERALRVPLVIVAPGREAGRAVDPVTLVDLFPTLTELCGLPPKPELDGRSMAPMLGGERMEGRSAVSTHRRGNHTVRTVGWRLTRYADGSKEMFDYRSDPGEWRNLAKESEFRPKLRELATLLPRRSAPDAPRQ